MSVARMVVIRCFCVSAFGELRRLVFARRDREDQIPVARALLSSTAPSRSKDRDSELEARHSRVAFWRKHDNDSSCHAGRVERSASSAESSRPPLAALHRASNETQPCFQTLGACRRWNLGRKAPDSNRNRWSSGHVPLIEGLPSVHDFSRGFATNDSGGEPRPCARF